MHTHREKRVLPHTAQQMFDMVADVERYPEFLPWCIGCRIVKRNGNAFTADLMVGYKVLREKFTSKVELSEPGQIDVTYITGPMKHLYNQWRFTDNADGSCTVDFFIEFQFRNRIFEKLVGKVFDEIVKRMVGAFVERADDLYGSKEPLHQL